MHMLKLGLAQCKQTNDFDSNRQTIFRFLEEAADQHVQILCFPETQTVGYRVDVAAPDTPVPVDQLEELHGQVAKRCGELGMACVLGTEIPLASEPHHGKPYNSALVISETGRILGVHHKSKLTPLDALAYTTGKTIETYTLCGINTGVVICFEGLRFAETTAECVRQGAQLVLHPQNNTTRPMDWKIPIHHAMIMTRAAENTIWFASCNCCYVEHQNSRSLIVAPSGQVHAQTELKQEQLLVSDIDLDLATHAMFNFDLEKAGPVLFGDTVCRDEYAPILPSG